MTNTKPDEANWFSQGGQNYSQYRPEYPQKLARYLAEISSRNHKALDVGCGTGQLTRTLSAYFTSVTGVDPSEDQLKNVSSAPGITYIHSAAECLPGNLCDYDLITVAQAAHWFRLEEFYREVRRVASPDAVIALISYGVLNIEGDVGTRFAKLYYEDIAHLWPRERKLVDSGYRELYFPFQELDVPDLKIEAEWNLQALLGYISTWSAVRQAQQKGQEYIFARFAAELAMIWGDPESCRKMSWPLNIRIGKVR
ncbi:class I SAM-dependent methyltransferase [Leclercia adecarboxylata]|uniref:class I SAM-dependent methyltransferase n=1 Tax=Leclercia adecarboxylata TaxID=83655 RepID=UPI002DBDB5C3|nr:class I SAM-dependent methyltransferase [Leclercia adecarboxylata]MEB6381544.1 class I SAM-dependent methyltransferase [Leclercia adecarboxylata]